MSTKIHDGRRLDGGIAKVYPRLVAVKMQAQAIAQQLTNRFMAYRMLEMEKTPDMFTRAWTDLADRQQKIIQTGRRDPAVDFDCELWLFPGKNQTLAMLKTDRDEYEEWFDKLDWVQEYGYWTNTDPPDGVTQRQWDIRRDNWDKALGETAVPSDLCLTFVLASGSRASCPTIEDLHAVIKEITAVPKGIEASTEAKPFESVPPVSKNTAARIKRDKSLC